MAAAADKDPDYFRKEGKEKLLSVVSKHGPVDGLQQLLLNMFEQEKDTVISTLYLDVYLYIQNLETILEEYGHENIAKELESLKMHSSSSCSEEDDLDEHTKILSLIGESHYDGEFLPDIVVSTVIKNNLKLVDVHECALLTKYVHAAVYSFMTTPVMENCYALEDFIQAIGSVSSMFPKIQEEFEQMSKKEGGSCASAESGPSVQQG
eukprot:TRINITY_DN19375_c0_g1_i1.p1 TRINITY_DN19375_c0_g1~~TRINITY_DN19375_c0_g1_i1.p1  ORF type:complete len:208 (+),score=23.10 TRINITY_DN19375_c0_g1_i1:471-1094(+)